MSDLLEILGQQNLDRLSRAVGGTPLSIPRHFGTPPNGGRDTSIRLIRLVGPDLALLLVLHFADSTIYVPRPANAPTADPKVLKRLAAKRALSARVIALKLGCSTRTVEKARARLAVKRGRELRP